MIGFIIAAIIYISIIIFVIRVPIIVANHRHITGSELNTIRILAWCGLIVGITWPIALILSLVYQPSKWVDKNENETIEERIQNDEIDFEKLEKLADMKNKGILTEEEFNIQKKQILGL